MAIDILKGENKMHIEYNNYLIDNIVLVINDQEGVATMNVESE